MQEQPSNAAAPPKRAALLFRDPEARDCSVEVPLDGGHLGAAPECLVRSTDPEVADKHASLLWTDGAWTVCDQDSKGGTFVNEERISQAQALKHGDVIRCGSLQVRYIEVADEFDPKDPLIHRRFAGRYLLHRRIAEGSTAVVYSASDLGLSMSAAVKVLTTVMAGDASWVERFHAQAQAQSILRHPGTVRVYLTDQEGPELHYTVLERLDTESLRQELDRQGRLPAERALRMIIGACWPLVEAHEMLVVHSDLKPDSIFPTPMAGYEDLVKLLFPTAMVWPTEPPRPPGVIFGTPAYMSPEQARAQKLDARSDIYSLGVVLYELLSGQPPFTGAPMDVVLAHLQNEPPPLVDVPEPAVRVTMQALAKDPAQRPQSCKELAEMCRCALAELSK